VPVCVSAHIRLHLLLFLFFFFFSSSSSSSSPPPPRTSFFTPTTINCFLTVVPTASDFLPLPLSHTAIPILLSYSRRSGTCISSFCVSSFRTNLASQYPSISLTVISAPPGKPQLSSLFTACLFSLFSFCFFLSPRGPAAPLSRLPFLPCHCVPSSSFFPALTTASAPLPCNTTRLFFLFPCHCLTDQATHLAIHRPQYRHYLQLVYSLKNGYPHGRSRKGPSSPREPLEKSRPPTRGIRCQWLGKYFCFLFRRANKTTSCLSPAASLFEISASPVQHPLSCHRIT
jgi:hypothetical protein